jgi:anti-anti-sigma regulatory factor
MSKVPETTTAGVAVTTAPGGLPDSVTFAEVGGDVVVIRVKGRGNFANSFELKRISEVMFDKRPKGQCRFVIDLADCETMDSTFMGQLASIGLRQRREATRPLVVVNPNAQNQRLMSTLGLCHFTEVHIAKDAPMPAAEDFCSPEMTQLDKVDQILHMIEAHQTLCDAESGNQVRFESVLRYLHESLDKEKSTSGIVK